MRIINIIICIFALALGMVAGGLSKGTVVFSYDNELATHYSIEENEYDNTNEPEVGDVIFCEIQLQELIVSPNIKIEDPDGQLTEEIDSDIEMFELETPTVFVDVSSVEPIKDIFDEIKNC